MAEIPGQSFIPKQNTAKATRRATTRQAYLFSVLCYVIFFGTLIAVVTLFAYQQLTAKRLSDTILSYDQKTTAFNVTTLNEVIELDERLDRTRELLDTQISLRSALAVIEAATIDTVQFREVSFERGESNQVALAAIVVTDSFDSVLFQREMYQAADELSGVIIEDVEIEFIAPDDELGDSGRTLVGFSALFELDPSSLQFTPEEREVLPASPSSPVPPDILGTDTETATSVNSISTSTTP